MRVTSSQLLKNETVSGRKARQKNAAISPTCFCLDTRLVPCCRPCFALRASQGTIPRRCAATNGGGERDRTDDLLLAKQALSQLSYTPLRAASPRPPSHFVLRRAPSGFALEGEVLRSAKREAGWWVWLESNQRPPPYQDGALTG